MIGRVLETKKMKTFIFIKVGNANEVVCGQIDKSLEPRPHTSDIVKFDIENDPNEILPHFVNMDVLERCNAPEAVNPDMIQISLYKSKFEQIADEHFSKIGAVKVRTPTLGRYKGTSNIDPYETQNKKGKTPVLFALQRLNSYSNPIRHYHFFEKAPKHPLKAKCDLLPVKGMFRKQCLF